MNPRPGDVIFIDRGTYLHFGIYLGCKKENGSRYHDGVHVMHIHGVNGLFSKHDGGPEDTPMSDFLDGQPRSDVQVLQVEEKEWHTFWNITRKLITRSLLTLARLTLIGRIVGQRLSDEDVGKSVYVDKVYSPAETIKRARHPGKYGFDGLNGKEYRYSVLCNNCEHFAMWCKTGVSDSKQVDKAMAMLLPAPFNLYFV